MWNPQSWGFLGRYLGNYHGNSEEPASLSFPIVIMIDPGLERRPAQPNNREVRVFNWQSLPGPSSLKTQ